MWRQPQCSVAQGCRLAAKCVVIHESYQATHFEAQFLDTFSKRWTHLGTATEHPHLATHLGPDTDHSPQRQTTRAKTPFLPNPGFHLLPWPWKASPETRSKPQRVLRVRLSPLATQQARPRNTTEYPFRDNSSSNEAKLARKAYTGRKKPVHAVAKF